MRALLMSIFSCFVALTTVAPATMADDTGVATTLHETVRKGNLLCLASHEHAGTSQNQPTKKLALAVAVNDWAGFTAWEYGTDWAYWKLAHRKQVKCGGGPGSFGCSIAASPCRRIGRQRRR